MHSLSSARKRGFLTGLFLALAVVGAPAQTQNAGPTQPAPETSFQPSLKTSPQTQPQPAPQPPLQALSTTLDELSEAVKEAASDLWARFSVKPGVAMAVADAARHTGLPESFLRDVFYKESWLNPEAKPRKKNGQLASSACGLGQLLKSTFLLELYEHGAPHGIDGKTFITRAYDPEHDVLDYKLQNPQIQGFIDKICVDPRLGAELGAENLRGTILSVQQLTKRPARAAEAYIGHVYGMKAAAKAIPVFYDPSKQNTLTRDYFRANVIEANPGLFYAQKPVCTTVYTGRKHHLHAHTVCHKRPLTVAETRSIFEKAVGTVELPMLKPPPGQTPLETLREDYCETHRGQKMPKTAALACASIPAKYAQTPLSAHAVADAVEKPPVSATFTAVLQAAAVAAKDLCALDPAPPAAMTGDRVAAGAPAPAP